MSSIYKISHIINGTVKYIYVFNGNTKNKAEHQDKLFQRNPADELFAGIFNPAELKDIVDNTIQVRFISERLHLDDTIEIIKKKLLLHLKKELNASFDEIYFFIMQPEQFKTAIVYQNVTQNEKLDLTKERLTQFLYNIDEIDVATLPDKEIYTYDDILELNLEQDSFTVAKPLGQKIASLKDDYSYPYTVNPFNVEIYDIFLEKFADEIITTTNKNILMDYGVLLNNTIYLCLAEDVLNFGTDYNLNLAESSTLKIYFPYLHAKDINTLDQLNERKQELLGETNAMLTPVFEKNIENVNLFYEIYDTRKEELNFKDVGIKSLSIIIHQPSAFHLPLDNVFKLIHATQDVPLIKMNLTKRQEKIYRLYADKIATNGKKIPYLDKGSIFKWDKIMGKNKSVAVYIEHYEEETSSKTPIFCEFNSDGSILITANFNTSITYDAVNELFIKEVNPVIDVVKDYLAQDGYVLNNFVDLKNSNTEILNIEFSMNIEITKDINLTEISGCLTSMFNVINDNLSKGIRLRFKRVSNYNEMESQEALIMDMSQPYLGYTDSDIVKTLQTNFQLSEKAAIEKYAEVKRAQEIMQTGNRRLKKKTNPGFLTSIVKQLYNNKVIINVTGINNIGYLTTMYIYLDTLIRITQNQSSTQVSKKRIKTICTGKKNAEEQQVIEIIAHIEQPNVHMTIEAQELVFNKEKEIEEKKEEEEEEDIDEAEMMARFGYVDDEEMVENEIISETGGAKKLKINTKKIQTPEEREEAEASPLAESEREASPQAQSSPLEEGVVGAQPLLDTDLTGQSLSNPSPFEKRIRKYDKNLFVSDTGKKNFSSYATDCQMNRRRQPVVLTDTEKERIDKEHPGSYSEAIKYGSDPSKQFWYICPRYWDMKNNTSLAEEDVDKNLVIPKKTLDNKVPAGKHIFEFNDYGTEHLKNKEYITHYPGFLKKKDEGSKCLPCCFKKWNGPTQVSLRAQCTNDTTIVVPPGRKKHKDKEEIDEYILAPDKFPITQDNRFGYLPLAVQKFLHTDNKKCQVSEMNANLKQDHECLLRHSVEINHTQSFVACIADIWFESYTKIHKESVKPTIKRMKELFSEALTIDTFISLQNGNLIKLFYKQSDDNDISDMDKYADIFSKNDSKLYQLADKTNPDQMNALIKIARAYANFLDYLKDDTVDIDYEYLWDLICKPNPKLFPKGINMVIIELTRKDITDNVELICPSNHYASSFFDAKKSVILILKIDNFYEPIYAYKTNEVEQTITRTFNIMDNSIMPNLKFVLELIKTSFNSKCAAKPSMPITYNKVHKFERNIPLDKLINLLQINNYDIEQQVMNYDSKIIGVVAIANQDNTKGFIPCYPSAISFALAPDIVYMNDAYSDTYEASKDFLNKLYVKTKQQIPCKPYMKIIEDERIVGILTITNQFVMIDEPTQDTFGDDLKIMKNVNYNEVDAIVSTSTTVDMERVNYIKKIQLETKFYNVFRNTARHLLGQYQHKDIRREIEEKIASPQSYLKKLRSIETLLRNLMQTMVVFHPYTESELLKLDTITNCYTNCQNKPYCRGASGAAEASGAAAEATVGVAATSEEAVSSGGAGEAEASAQEEECGALMIPITNLISQKSNDTFYYGKLADEIVRYSRIKSFIFNPKAVLSFSQLKYNLRENEIILLQSLLTQEYFENIIAAKINPYIKYNSYDTTQPIIAQKYSNVDEGFEQETKPELDNECSVALKEHIANKYWNAIFPIKSKEQIYHSTPAVCSFNAIFTIIKAASNSTDITKNSIKEVLLNDYLKLYATHSKQLLNIMRAQGKKILAGQLLKNQISLPDMIMSEDYYATLMDVWILAIHYNLPLVFISDTILMENNGRYMIAHKPTDDEQAYYFLKVSAILAQLSPIYTLILDESNRMKIAVDRLRNEAMKNDIQRTSPNILNFIENFSLTEANKWNKMGRAPPLTVAAVPATVVPAVPVPATAVPAVPVPAAAVPATPATAVPATVPDAPVKKLTRKLKIKN